MCQLMRGSIGFIAKLGIIQKREKKSDMPGNKNTMGHTSSRTVKLF